MEGPQDIVVTPSFLSAVLFIRRPSGGLEGLLAVCLAGLSPNSRFLKEVAVAIKTEWARFR